MRLQVREAALGGLRAFLAGNGGDVLDVLASPVGRELSFRLEQALEVTDALWELVPVVEAAGQLTRPWLARGWPTSAGATCGPWQTP